jgi:hypothetical protein
MQCSRSGGDFPPDHSSLNLPEISGGAVVMNLTLSREILRALIAEVFREVLPQLDWPRERLALSEAEAAQAIGVGRHVLRDLRLRGLIEVPRIGKRVIYTRAKLLQAIDAIQPVAEKLPDHAHPTGISSSKGRRS